jgi:protein-tyrosine phosphatase
VQCAAVRFFFFFVFVFASGCCCRLMKGNVHTANFYKRLFKPSKRSQLIMDGLQHIATSRLAWFLGVSLICATVTISRGMWWLLSIPLALFGLMWHQLVFEAFVVMHVLEAQLGLFQWYTMVDDNLILGAIPLEDRHHLDELQKLNVKAIVSVVQPWELETTTLFGRPVRPEKWRQAGIQQFVLPATDFVPPSFDTLDEGAKILDSYLANNQRVYVHCKSGIGRSASVILAYFLKFKQDDLATAHVVLKSKRAVVFTETSRQMQNMIEYNKRLHPSHAH